MWQLHTTLESIGATWCKSTETTKHGQAEHSMDMKLSCCGQRDQLDNKHVDLKFERGKITHAPRLIDGFEGVLFSRCLFSQPSVPLLCVFSVFPAILKSMRSHESYPTAACRATAAASLMKGSVSSSGERSFPLFELPKGTKTQETKNGKSWWS